MRIDQTALISERVIRVVKSAENIVSIIDKVDPNRVAENVDTAKLAFNIIFNKKDEIIQNFVISDRDPRSTEKFDELSRILIVEAEKLEMIADELVKHID